MAIKVVDDRGGRAGIGVAEILLAWRWQRSGKIVTGSRDQRP
jgi:hypothetical protein